VLGGVPVSERNVRYVSERWVGPLSECGPPAAEAVMAPFKLLTIGLAGGSAAIAAVLFGAQPAWANATLTASPQTVQAGETISITGSGFTSCLQPQSLEVRWDLNPLALISLVGQDASGPAASPRGRRIGRTRLGAGSAAARRGIGVSWAATAPRPSRGPAV
jgi:hypothetical protein